MSKKTASPGTTPTADPVSQFEGALTELEGIVSRMEHGDLPLEESLQLFERGMQLSKLCRGSLETAELRIKNLLEADSGHTADPKDIDA